MSHVLPKKHLPSMKQYNKSVLPLLSWGWAGCFFALFFLAQHLEFYFLSGEYSLRISSGLDVSNADVTRILKKV